MSSILEVRLKKAEGSILRLLGQIGRRGYDVLGVTATLTGDRTAFDVRVEFEPFVPLAPGKPRPVDVLPALVSKLEDVEWAELKSAPAKLPSEPLGKGAPQEPKKKTAAGKPTGDMHWEE